MPVTIKDLGRTKAAPQRNIASLIGGIAIAIGCFILILLVGSQETGHPPGIKMILASLAVALAIGVWTRIADL